MKPLFAALRVLVVAALAAGGAWHFDLLDAGSMSRVVRTGTAADCDAPPDLVVDFTTSQPVLTDTRPEDAPDAGPAGGDLMGLATAQYGFDLGVRTMEIRSAEVSCVRIDRITVTAGKTPEIWLNPGLVEGTCKYDRTLEHEREHVRNYHDHLAAFEQRLEAHLLEVMTGATSLPARDGETFARARSELKDAAITAVEALHEISANVAARKNAIMDTPSEYLRISRLCP